MTTSPVSGILTPGLPGTFLHYLSVHLDQIHLYGLEVFFRHHNERFHPLVVLLFFCWFTFANFSPVSGFLVVGVVIVLFLVHLFDYFLCTALSLDQIRVLSNGISSVDVIGSPSTGPYFVTSSTGGATTSYQIFNSWFTWNVLLATFRCVWIKFILMACLISSPPYSVISSTGCFVIFLLVHRQLFPC